MFSYPTGKEGVIIGYNTQIQCVSSLGDASMTPSPQSPDPWLKPKGIRGGRGKSGGVRSSNSGSVAEEPRGQSPFQWPMTGQDWGSEGLASDQAGAKGPLHIMVHARQAWVLGSEALKVLLVNVCVCVSVCVCVCNPPSPAQIYSGLQPVNLGEPEDSLRGWPLVLGQVLWSEEVSEVRKCCVVLNLRVCLLIWLDVFTPLMRGGCIVQLI